MKITLITVNSAGLGHGLADYLLAQNRYVFGCTQSGFGLPDIQDRTCDTSVFLGYHRFSSTCSRGDQIW